MPSRSFQKDAFNNESKIKNYKKSTSKRYSNGKLVSPESSESKIQGAGEIFKKNGMVGAGETTADSILQTLGISFINGASREHSFLSTQDEMTPTNPNIIDEEGLKILKNEKIESVKYFGKKTDNPFYNLDEGRSFNRQQEVNKQKQANQYTNRTNMAISFFDLNILNTNTPSLGQFK
tara:strand:- start:8107 stop:8640 length:534 start_codon:yes stop_codon:yes gene_type:complete